MFWQKVINNLYLLIGELDRGQSLKLFLEHQSCDYVHSTLVLVQTLIGAVPVELFKLK